MKNAMRNPRYLKEKMAQTESQKECSNMNSVKCDLCGYGRFSSNVKKKKIKGYRKRRKTIIVCRDCEPILENIKRILEVEE